MFHDILVVTNPDAVAIETQYISFNAMGAIKVVEVRGVLEGLYFAYCFANNKVPSIINVTPTEAKHSVGVIKRLKRKESKSAVKEAVLSRFPQFSLESEKKEDIFDAIAIGLAGGFKLNMQNKS